MNSPSILLNDIEYVRKDSIKSEIAKISNSPVGHYCIVRCTQSGVWAGTPSYHNGQNVTLTNARRLYFWKAKKGHTLSAVANYGITESKLPAPVDIVYLTEVCELIPTTKEAQKSIVNHPPHNE